MQSIDTFLKNKNIYRSSGKTKHPFKRLPMTNNWSAKCKFRHAFLLVFFKPFLLTFPRVKMFSAVAVAKRQKFLVKFVFLLVFRKLSSSGSLWLLGAVKWWKCWPTKRKTLENSAMGGRSRWEITTATLAYFWQGHAARTQITETKTKTPTRTTFARTTPCGPRLPWNPARNNWIPN